jgi:predicted amidohydrolase YtcJ
MAAMTYSSKDPRNSVAYFNGAVYTVDQSRPWAEAFIVTSGGFFEAVGTNQEIKAIAKERCLVSYDLQGNFVMPGIHDAHTHLLAASMQRLGEASISLDTTGSAIGKNIAKGCCACPFSNVYGDWVIGNFYQAAQFPDGKPDRKYIDDEYPDIPVLIREVSCHRILLNSAGLARMGIDRDVKDPHGGYYIRRPDGELTGEIVETAAQPVWNNIPKTPLHYVKTALTMAIRECHRYGITSAQEASANTLLLHAAKELEDENRFDIDLCTHIVCAPEGPTMEAIDSLALLLDVSGSFASKHLHTHFVKFFMDGAPLPPEFTQSDLDAGGRPVESRLNLTFDKLLGYLVKYDARGMTCKIHVAGEGSVRRVLDVLEELRRQNPNGPKHELAHCNAVHPGRLAPVYKPICSP